MREETERWKKEAALANHALEGKGRKERDKKQGATGILAQRIQLLSGRQHGGCSPDAGWGGGSSSEEEDLRKQEADLEDRAFLSRVEVRSFSDEEEREEVGEGETG